MWRTVKSNISGREISFNDSEYVDLNGNIVKRNRIEYPYSYDPYVIYKGSDFHKTDTPYYSDRIEHCYFTAEEFENALSQAGLKRYGASWESDRMSWKNSDHVTRLMSILLKKDVKCTAILEGCNYGNGYPYWLVYIR